MWKEAIVTSSKVLFRHGPEGKFCFSVGHLTMLSVSSSYSFDDMVIMSMEQWVE
jgi:hypothetical protein